MQSGIAIGDWEGRVYLCWCKLAFVASQAVLRSSLCLLMVGGALLVGWLFVIVYLALCQISWFIFMMFSVGKIPSFKVSLTIFSPSDIRWRPWIMVNKENSVGYLLFRNVLQHVLQIQ
ncbi:Hypothetical_protein [Hexamita inflata]|uniref:Hypothetical_protein n=1 Tax=Hexamita inflata TaxID=28002 RepID=A0ABP1J645_9EUKA